MLAALGLTAAAEAVYRAMVNHPAWGVADLVDELGLTEEAVQKALDRLFELALLRESVERPGALHVLDPDVGLRSVLARKQAELARRQQEVVESEAAISRLIDDLSRTRLEHCSSAIELLGMDAIQDRLAQLALETEFEVLTFMPGGAQSAAALEQARKNDEQLLRRDVRVRTIGLDSIRNDPATMAHARFLVENGAEFRTSPILPPRMILVDRRIALVPINPDRTREGVLCLSSAGAVAAMLALFDQVWEIATPLGAPRDPGREGLSGQERALLRLLGEGLTDEAAAGRLGFSPRSARRMMADLMERLDARSRFEAGLRAAQRGWL